MKTETIELEKGDVVFLNVQGFDKASLDIRNKTLEKLMELRKNNETVFFLSDVDITIIRGKKE